MRSNATLQLLLMLSATFFEVFICVWGFSNGVPFYFIPFVLSFYHFGYVFTSLINFSYFNHAFLLTYLICSGVLMCSGITYQYIPCLALGIFLISSLLQYYKDYVKAKQKIDIRRKRVAKMMGMLLAGVGYFDNAMIYVCFSVLLSTLFLQLLNLEKHDYKSSTRLVDINWRFRLGWVQLFHHIHYFLYCYIFWGLLKQSQTWLIGPFFILGWLIYFVMEAIFKIYLKKSNLLVMGLGHIFNGFVLSALLLNISDRFNLFLWLITGLGGGTVYMLSNHSNQADLQRFEDIGHIIGCLLSALLILLFGDLRYSIIAAVVFALMCGIVAIIDRTKLVNKTL